MMENCVWQCMNYMTVIFVRNRTLCMYKGKVHPCTIAGGGGGQRHAPAALYPRERPGTHCTRGWVGPRAGLDRCGKSRLPHRDSIPAPSSPKPVATPTTLPGPLMYVYPNKQYKSILQWSLLVCYSSLYKNQILRNTGNRCGRGESTKRSAYTSAIICLRNIPCIQKLVRMTVGLGISYKIQTT